MCSSALDTLLSSPYFDDLITSLYEVFATSLDWLEKSSNNDNISKINTDLVDTYRYRAIKLFDSIIDVYDQRIGDPRTDEIIFKTDEFERRKQQQIDRINAKLIEAKTDEEKQMFEGELLIIQTKR